MHVTQIEYSPNHEVALITCRCDETAFDFEEGQFVFLETMDYEYEGKKLKKPYSIASTHNQYMNQNTLTFFVKKSSETGMSHYLTQILKHSDQLKFQGPMGVLTDDKEYGKYLLVSTGSGLAPLYAHYLHITQEDSHFDKIINLFGEKTQNDMIPSMEIMMQTHNEKIKNIVCLSRQEKIPTGYYKGHVQDYIDKAINELQDNNFVAFLCGKPEMIMGIQQKLLDT
ncbi:MAG: hypothetical protein GXP45_04580 [bacterium]|nr:hypothetical protein [bacterium]